MSCTVFFSHLIVCLEGDLAEKPWLLLRERGGCRFARADYWLNGERQNIDASEPCGDIPNLQSDIEECDLLILVGRPEELLARRVAVKDSRVMTVLITVAEGDGYFQFKEAWGANQAVFMCIPPGIDADRIVGLALDSLVGLFNHFENGLVIFNLYDLRQIWPNGSHLEVEGYEIQIKDLNLFKSRFAEIPSVENLKSILVVVRGGSSLTPEVLETMVHNCCAGREGTEGVHWYTVEHPQIASDLVQGVVFICPK
jgi:hypothetical protein